MISPFSATCLPSAKPKIPKYVEGMLALCKYCGFTSIEFNRCQRCKRKFPDDVKSISVLDKKKRNQASLGSKERLYPKPWVKLETSLEAAVKSSKRGRQPVKRNRKLVEEPVCLTLSSDEEDRSQSNDASMLSDRSASGQALLGDGAALVASDPAVTSSAMDKEPVIPDEDDCSEWEAQHSQGPGVRGGGRELDLESIIDGSMPGSYTLLQCRIVRIGSYKVVPRERVILSTIGIRIAVPSIEDETKSVTLWIDISEIRKVLIHFGRGLPVLFFYTMPAAANRVRESLKMESKEGPYYDPKSANDTQRRITLLPERLHVESKVALKNIFGSLENVFAELSNKEAKDILVRASPKERLYPKPWVKLETSLEAAAKSSKRGRQPVKRNRKLVEEPVCLTLSSDEEDRSQSNDASMLSDRSASGQALLGDGAALVASDPAVTSSAMDKEPVIPDEDDCSEWEAQHSQGPGVRGGGRELDLESIIDGSMPGSYTLLQCRIVRIGSYKVVPRERVILSTIGIRIAVPSIEDETKSVTLWIDISEIRKVLIHFGRGLPVLFFYTMHAAANRVRESLKMESKEGPYYDPKSADDTQRRITLLPERLHVESKVALKNIFGSLENVFAELSNKEAKDILVRASPKEGGGGARVPQQRATQGPHVRHRHGPATHEEGAAARLPGRQRIAAGGLLQSDRSRELQSAQ